LPVLEETCGDGIEEQDVFAGVADDRDDREHPVVAVAKGQVYGVGGGPIGVLANRTWHRIDPKLLDVLGEVLSENGVGVRSGRRRLRVVRRVLTW
jgi:hypothetical protein